jgi:Rps23 Pro-64 3,4-dihydroxylase Tpa1-like proline 4-hydroxylase
MTRNETSIGFSCNRGENPLISIIKNFYSKKEMKLISEELDYLTDKLLSPERTNSATENSKLLKKNKGLWLEDYYENNSKKSDILKLNTKIYEPNFLTSLISVNPIFRYLENSEYSTLLSYYENSDYYKEHSDDSTLTILTYFFKEPKRFKNGSIKFNDFNVRVEVENNMTIIFPGCYLHEVDEISMLEEHRNKKLGRYCMTQFIRPIKPKL